jgi:hypothetical protein
MYSPLNTKSGSVETGAAYAAGIVGGYTTVGSPDGLQVDTSGATVSGKAVIPDRLYNWLLDVRLLRNIPLSYMIPDSALLPPESIRFFNVDLTWVDRVIDGVFSAANTGTVDITYSAAMLQLVREALDSGLSDLAAASVSTTTWTPAQGMTGMLIRSDLVRRWPDMIVRAYAGTDEKTSPQAPVLRAEPISKDVYIAIFAGTPQMVQLREPHVGVRFGLEFDEPNNQYFYELRKPTDGSLTVPPPGKPLHQAIVISKLWRTVPVATIAGAAPSGPRTVAIELMRQPFVQQFMNSLPAANNQTITVPETRGYIPAPASLQFRNGGKPNLKALADRVALTQRMGKV